MKKINSSKIVLLIIILAYTIVSFYKLGNIKNSVTYVNVKDNEQLKFEIEDGKVIDTIMIYNANNETNLSVFYTDDLLDYENYLFDSYIDLDYSNVFKWNKLSINTTNTQRKYVVFESNLDTTTIGEIEVYDYEGNTIHLKPLGEKEKKLLDENNLIPKEISYMNSSYFDEVYFPRTSYETLHNLKIYEYTHPPLGKLIISIPIQILGLTPFAYRCFGNIAGILMIPIIYLISKTLFKRERYALFAAAIMALDGMHFLQTRIGTVDSFLVLFSLISFLFFLKYLFINSDGKKKNKIISLLLSGTFWGMAVSVKWTALYYGIGMAIIYFIKFLYDSIINKKIDIKLILWSILGFIIIPLCIYTASYIPIMNNPNDTIYFKSEQGEEYIYIHDVTSFINYQIAMYNYHANVNAEHPYSSNWYEWPIMKRPVWFYYASFEDGSIGTIACMGNPAIWWLGIATTIFTFFYSIVKKDIPGILIIVMILATLLPYSFITRCMFIYHYFITLPFVMLTIVYVISRLSRLSEKFDYLIPILTLVFTCFFIYFYPVYSGKPVNIDYIKETEWLDTWEYDGLPRET